VRRDAHHRPWVRKIEQCLVKLSLVELFGGLRLRAWVLGENENAQ